MRYIETDMIRKRLLFAGGVCLIAAPFVVGALIFGGWEAAVVTLGICAGIVVFVAGCLMLMEAFD
jgi:hypothetical protein